MKIGRIYKCGLETADLIDLGTVGGAQAIVVVVDTKNFLKIFRDKIETLGLTQLKV